MTEPLVSICIPTYNGEKYLRQCIESCMNQTFNDYEIIICDDGSSDKTLEIIESYSNSSRLIKLFRNEKNLGLVGNWNKCLEHAKGEWIKFVFQDDFITRACLEKFVRETTENIPLIVCKRNFVLDKLSNEEEINYYKHIVRTLENTGKYESKIFSAEKISHITVGNILLNFIAEPSLTFFKRSLVKEVENFDSELKQICDLEFFLRIATKYGLVYIPEQLAVFRIHSSSTTERNLTGRNYQIHYIEGLLFAIKLQTKPIFASFRNYLSFSEKFKLKLYIKYRSYKALRAIKDQANEKLYESVRKEYKSLFFKSYEIPLMRILLKLRA